MAFDSRSSCEMRPRNSIRTEYKHCSSPNKFCDLLPGNVPRSRMEEFVTRASCVSPKLGSFEITALFRVPQLNLSGLGSPQQEFCEPRAPRNRIIVKMALRYGHFAVVVTSRCFLRKLRPPDRSDDAVRRASASTLRDSVRCRRQSFSHLEFPSAIPDEFGLRGNKARILQEVVLDGAH
jgi:hypothetical protein